MSSFERMEFEGSGKQEFSWEEGFVESLSRKEEALTNKSNNTPYGLNRNSKLLASGIVLGLGLGSLALTGCSEVIAKELLERSQSEEFANPPASQVYEEDLLHPQTVTEEGDLLLSDPVGPQYTEEIQEDEVEERVIVSDIELPKDDGIETKEEKKEETQEISEGLEETYYWEEVPEEKKNFLAKNEISQADTERQVVVMTYDDGGSKENIEHIMQVYEKYDLRTTFFVTGQWVERNPELVKEMIERGFEIGCHGWDHAEMTSLGKKWASKQIEDFLLAMYEIDSEYEVEFIRFPFGSRNDSLREIAGDFGLQSIMWSHSSGGMDGNTYYNVMRYLKWGSIVLSHSTRSYDVSETERILESFLEQGYEVATVGEGISEKDSSSGE